MTQRYPHIVQKLKESGLRPTRQRVMLGALIWKDVMDRHLTAEILHNEAMTTGVRVSLATIYNTLHQFTDAGLLKEITVDSGRSYFDTNLSRHHHFLNEDNGYLEDIDDTFMSAACLPQPPNGTRISGVDVIVRVRA